MDSTLPLYRQLSSRFLLLALSFTSLCFLASVLYFQHEQDLAVLKYQQLPSIEKYNQRQLLLIKNDRLINEVLNSKYAAKFGDYYQTINEDLVNISALSRNNRQVLKQLTLQWQQQAENANRLSESYRRNIQLKDNVIIQLTLVADSLSNLIATQAQQQNDLYRQITQEKLTARVTASKATVLSHLVNDLNINREFHRALIDSLVMFSQLDLHYDLINFDYIQQKTHHEITHWLASATNIVTKDSNENMLFEQITVLNDLLFSEQNTFDKWREQLKRANAFQAQLAKQKTELMPLLDKALVVQPIKSSVLEQQFITLMAKANIGLQAKHYIWLIAAIFALLTIIFISLLLSLHRRIKHYGAQSTAVVEEWVVNGEVTGLVPGLEIATILNTVEQLSRPEHSETDFRKQQQRHQTQIAVMSRHSGHVFWQFPALSKQKQQQLRALLGSKLTYQHWRQYFSRVDVRAIVSMAKQAKINNSVEKMALISLHGKAIVLTIEHLEGSWCGSLCDAEEYRRLKDGNAQLQQELKLQSQTDKLTTIASSDELTLLTSSAMQQRQMLSLAQGSEQSAYQQLGALLSWSEQRKISAQLRCDDFVLTLSTVNITNEIDTVLANICLHQVPNNNAIYLNVSGELNSSVTLESELFQAMINAICQKMLSGQQGVVLDVNMQALELSTTQQILRMSFQVNQPINTDKLSQVMTELVTDDEISTQVSQHYLRDLQLIFNVSNKKAQLLEAAEKFSFELPLVLDENVTSSSELKTINQAKAKKLAKSTLLVIATNKSSRERICQQLVGSKAVVETMQDLLLFTRQFSVKRLTKNRLDVVILSPEVYLSDYDLITQHLASLPTKIQPKIMVIQPFNCTTLQRTGLFSVCNLPWFTGELVANVAQLMSGSDNTNLLVTKEAFSPYRFKQTQVEVLLAVAESRVHQDLLRILSWFGLQVTVVSQQESLERLWHSGRFLIVITEFFPFKVDVGITSTLGRGVFALTNKGNSTEDFFSTLNLDALWQGGDLAPTFDIEKLSQQLAPWLMPVTDNKISHVVATSPIDKSELSDENIILSTLEVDITDAEIEPEISMADLEQALDFNLMLEHYGDKQSEHEQESKVQSEAFNLASFAENQGTADLAAFMLDDYITDININALGLDNAIQRQDVNLALSHLKLLIELAKIIAAEPFLKQCLALNNFLNQSVNAPHADSKFSSQQKEQLQQQLNHLKLCLEQLTEFAESI